MAYPDRRWLLALAAVTVLPAQGADAGIEFFEKHVRPLLAAKCYVCHSGKTVASGGLRADTRDGLLKGGQHGPAVVPGRTDTGLLLRAISYQDASLRMPPTGMLTAAEITNLTKWVEMGAPDPRDAAAAAPGSAPQDKTWWAFQKFRESPTPRIRNRAWPRAWIDAYLLAAMEAKGLAPAPPADKRTLLRRVTFDLTGLPPTPDEVRAFLADSSPRAYEKVVDRLLASPHYGERQARHWLDLARYAETDGHEFDREKPNAWRYRDYVIRAFNSDLPFDEFVREQLAGDLIPNQRIAPGGAHLDSPLGTSFLALYEERNAADDLAEVRAEKVDNQIDTVTKTFLGLTVACARCHDHKFDPIPTRDYYALAGVLHSKNVIQAALDGPAWTEQTQRLVEELRGLDKQIADLLKPEPLPPAGTLGESDRLIADFANGVPEGWRIEGPAYIARWLWQPPAELTGFLYSRSFRADRKYLHVRLAGSSDSTSARQPGQIRVSLVGDGRDITVTPDPSGKFTWKTAGVGRMFDEMAYIEVCDRTRTGRLAVDKIVLSDRREPPRDFASLPDAAPEPASPSPELRALLERRAALTASLPQPVYGMIAVEDVPGDVRLHIKGDHRNLGDWVPRGFLGAIAPPQRPAIQGSGRLELADAIADPNNPLTARVLVNRIWKQHFGEGLVRTVDNFGRTGELPSHPELLDTLAARFVTDGWSIKKLHRTLVLSAAYRMSSRSTETARKIDPDNRLLSHMPVRRLEGEAIRDAILSVSGALDRTLHGPSVMPHISEYQDGRGKPQSGPLDGAGRRSIYIGVRRNFITPLFLAFDYPMTITTIGRRGASTVPSQALIMMNNEFIAKQAARWADTAQGSAKTPAARVRAMFEAAYARPAASAEVARSLEFVKTQARHYGQDPNAAFRAWTDLAHALFNAKEFIFIR
jgi:hypothetical protein